VFYSYHSHRRRRHRRRRRRLLFGRSVQVSRSGPVRLSLYTTQTPMVRTLYSGTNQSANNAPAIVIAHAHTFTLVRRVVSRAILHTDIRTRTYFSSGRSGSSRRTHTVIRTCVCDRTSRCFWDRV